MEKEKIKLESLPQLWRLLPEGDKRPERMAKDEFRGPESERLTPAERRQHFGEEL